MPLDQKIIDTAKSTLQTQGIAATASLILSDLAQGNELIARLILDQDVSIETATDLLEELENTNKVNTDPAYTYAQRLEKEEMKAEMREEKAGQKTKTEEIYNLRKEREQAQKDRTNLLSQSAESKRSTNISPNAKNAMTDKSVKKMQPFFQGTNTETQVMMMNTEKRWAWFTKPLYMSDKGKALFQALDTSKQIALLEHANLGKTAKQELFDSLVSNPNLLEQGSDLIAQSANDWVEIDKKIAARIGKSQDKNQLTALQTQSKEKEKFYRALEMDHDVKRHIFLNQNLTKEARGKLFRMMETSLQIEFIVKLEEHQKTFFALLKAEDAADTLYRLKTEAKENQTELAKKIFSQQEAKQQADIIKNLLKVPQNLTEAEKKAEEKKRKELVGELINSNKISLLQRELIFKEFTPGEAAEAFAAMPTGHTWLRESAFDRKLALLNGELDIKKRTAMFLALGKNETDETKKYNEKIEMLADRRLNEDSAIVFFRTSINRLKTEVERFQLALKLVAEIQKKNPQRAQLLFNSIRGLELQTNILLELTEKQAAKLFSGMNNAKRQTEILTAISKRTAQHPVGSVERQQLLDRSQKLFQSLESAPQQASILEGLNNSYQLLLNKIDSTPENDPDIQKLKAEANALRQLTLHIFVKLHDKNGNINHQQQAKILKAIRDPDLRNNLLTNLPPYYRAKVLTQGTLSNQRIDLFAGQHPLSQIEILHYLSSNMKKTGMASKLFNSIDSARSKAQMLDGMMGYASNKDNDLCAVSLGGAFGVPQQNQYLAEKLFQLESYENQKDILIEMERMETNIPIAYGDLEKGMSDKDKIKYRNDRKDDTQNRRKKLNTERVETFFDAMSPGNQERLLSDPELSSSEKNRKLQKSILEHVRTNPDPEFSERLLTKTSVINNIKDDPNDENYDKDYKYNLINSLPPQDSAKLFNDTTLTGNFKLNGHTDYFNKMVNDDSEKASQVLQNCDTSQQIKMLNSYTSDNPKNTLHAKLILLTNLDDKKRSDIFNCTNFTGRLDNRAQLFKELADAHPEQAVDVLNRSNMFTGSGKTLMQELDIATAKKLLMRDDLKDKKKYFEALPPKVKFPLLEDKELTDSFSKSGFTMINKRNSIPLRNSTIKKEREHEEAEMAEMKRSSYRPGAAAAA